jgi:uncharacterized protein (DUF1330 family)
MAGAPKALARTGESCTMRAYRSAEGKMAAYLVANIDVGDPAGFEEYRKKVGPIVAQYGGRFIVRGAEAKVLEGNPPIKRFTVLEFPSLAAAQKFYDSPEYKPVLKLRLASAKSNVILVDGTPG